MGAWPTVAPLPVEDAQTGTGHTSGPNGTRIAVPELLLPGALVTLTNSKGRKCGKIFLN
jgi:hypothetical protein